MEKNKTKVRIIKLTKNKYMVQKLGMHITPDSYGSLVPSRVNIRSEPMDLETAQAYLALFKKDKEVVEEIEV